MGIYRMNEPYGFAEGEKYLSVRNAIDNEIVTNRSIDKKQTEESFTKVEYNKGLESLLFRNANNKIVGQVPMSEIVPSDLIKDVKYDSDKQQIIIEFDNGDIVTIDLDDLINVQEAGDGLQLSDNKFSVKIADNSENFLQVSSDGIKNVGIQNAINAEKTRAMEAEAQETSDRISDVNEEEARAKEAEETLVQLINLEISNRTDDVNEEEVRAKEAENALDAKIDQEISNRTADVNDEEIRAKKAETTINNIIGAGFSTASTETITAKFNDLSNTVSSEISNRTTQDNQLQNSINNEVTARQGEITRIENLVTAETNRATTTERTLQSEIDELAENKVNKNDVYTKEETDTIVSDAVASVIDNAPETFDTLKEIAEYINSDSANGISMLSQIETNASGIADLKTKDEELQDAIDEEEQRAISAETGLQTAIDLKADKETTYTQDEVDAFIKAKETEIYNLTKLVGEIGGNVTYTYPNELETSLTELLKNNGTVKLNEDATISRFGPGVTAKNKVTINLNNHDLTSTSAGSNGAIMARGTQEITIGGKGTIEAGDGICIEANGSSASISPIINLTGSTTVYHTNRPGGELIYCYVGTINITNGTFRNDGESNYTLNCYDANYQNGTAKIIVTGGKFYDFNPADNSAEGEHTSFVPEGYHVEISTVTEEGVEHTVYTVKKDS